MRFGVKLDNGAVETCRSDRWDRFLEVSGSNDDVSCGDAAAVRHARLEPLSRWKPHDRRARADRKRTRFGLGERVRPNSPFRRVAGVPAELANVLATNFVPRQGKEDVVIRAGHKNRGEKRFFRVSPTPLQIALPSRREPQCLASGTVLWIVEVCDSLDALSLLEMANAAQQIPHKPCVELEL